VKTLVLCPSRDRPQQLDRMLKSVMETSQAVVAVYLDEDNSFKYIDVFPKYKDRVLVTVGPRIGPAKACQDLVVRHPEFEVYGLGVDDSIFTTPDWDRFVDDCLQSFPKRLGVVSAFHGHARWVNFAYVSRQWIEHVGWYVCPDLDHFCWDTVLEMLGDATNIVYATREQFFIDHRAEYTVAAGGGNIEPDSTKFLWWCVIGRHDLVQKLKALMAEAS